jgi:hypothetical protein
MLTDAVKCAAVVELGYGRVEKVMDPSAKVSDSRPGSPAQLMLWRHLLGRTRPTVASEGNHLQTIVTSSACTRQLHGGSRLNEPQCANDQDIVQSHLRAMQWNLSTLRPVARRPRSSRTCEHRTNFCDVPGPHIENFGSRELRVTQCAATSDFSTTTRGILNPFAR